MRPTTKRLERDLTLFGELPGVPVVHAPARVPPIPDRVPCVSLWRAWASLVAADLKPIETRSWVLQAKGKAPPPSGPAFWLAMHASHRTDGRVAGAVRPLPAVKLVPAGVVFAVALVTGVRPLKEEDAAKAHVFADDLWAWELEHVHVLEPMLSLARGYQKVGHLDGRVLRNSLGTQRREDRSDATTRREDWLSSDAGAWPVRPYAEAVEALGGMK